MLRIEGAPGMSGDILVLLAILRRFGVELRFYYKVIV